MATKPPFMKIDEVCQLTGLSRASIYNYVSDPEFAFPKQVRLGPNRVAWVRSEVERWIRQRKDARSDVREAA